MIQYQKLFNETGTRVVMDHSQSFSHLIIHVEEHLQEMVLKWDEEALYWTFNKIGDYPLKAN